MCDIDQCVHNGNTTYLGVKVLTTSRPFLSHFVGETMFLSFCSQIGHNRKGSLLSFLLFPSFYPNLTLANKCVRGVFVILSSSCECKEVVFAFGEKLSFLLISKIQVRHTQFKTYFKSEVKVILFL